MRSLWFAPLVAVAFACGGEGGGGGGGTGTCTPSSSSSFTITASGLAPAAVCVTPGGTVTFTNSDNVAHDIEPTSGCAELALGQIAPSQSRTATFATARVCTFHDADNASNSAFQGTVAVSQTTTTGPGY